MIERCITIYTNTTNSKIELNDIVTTLMDALQIMFKKQNLDADTDTQILPQYKERLQLLEEQMKTIKIQI
jgi:hypothetical protein